MIKIIKEIKSFAENRGTFERACGAITGLSLLVVGAGALLIALGNEVDSRDLYQTGVYTGMVGGIGLVSSFMSYGISRLTDRNRRNN